MWAFVETLDTYVQVIHMGTEHNYTYLNVP